MAAISHDKGFWFGLGFPKERLPDGWALREAKNEFAVAMDPEGHEYLVTDSAAYRWISVQVGCEPPKMVDLSQGAVSLKTA